MFEEPKPDLIMNSVSTYIFIIHQYYDSVDRETTDCYLIPLSEISHIDFQLIEKIHETFEEYETFIKMLSKYSNYLTEESTIKANIVAIYKK